MDKLREVHLGTGLFASFDGWQIWLRAERRGGDQLVALDPETWAELVAYAARRWPPAKPARQD